MGLSGLCTLVCLAIVLVLDVVRQASYPNLLPLLVVGIPVLLVGQIWTIAVVSARMNPDGPPERSPAFGGGVRLPTIVGGAPTWVYLAAVSMVAVGMLSFLLPLLFDHGPSSAPDPAGVLLFFFAFHWGVEASEH
jgi:hypothetical protein